MRKSILFTGGGSAGHVTPNIALIKHFQQAGWQVTYVGSINGIEKEIVTKINIAYYGIASGKLRRYFSWQNFLDPFKIILGIIQAFFLCLKIKPAVIFSKGGFVAFPVVVAGWLRRIPVVIHESDLVPGLANRLSFPFAKKVCLTFADSVKYFKDNTKILVTGTPIRTELFAGDATQGRKMCRFSADKKTILVFGGGLGADAINRIVRATLPQLLTHYQVVHLCGKGKLDASMQSVGYVQFEYLHKELPDVMACADLVISRAGANSLYELLALRKPHILIPLSKQASRGDQIINAKYFANLGLSQILFEEELTGEKFLEKMDWLAKHEEDTKRALANFMVPNSVELIYELIIPFSCKAERTAAIS